MSDGWYVENWRAGIWMGMGMGMVGWVGGC